MGLSMSYTSPQPKSFSRKSQTEKPVSLSSSRHQIDREVMSYQIIVSNTIVEDNAAAVPDCST